MYYLSDGVVVSVLSNFFFLLFFFLLFGSAWSLVAGAFVPAGAAVVPGLEVEPDAGAAEPEAGAVPEGAAVEAGVLCLAASGDSLGFALAGFKRASGSLSSAVGSFTGATVTSVIPG